MMKRIMNILMLSCKKASELIDKRYGVRLSMREKIMLRMHTSMCDACTTYQKQSKILDNVLHKHIHQHDENIPVTHHKELQKQIISKL